MTKRESTKRAATRPATRRDQTVAMLRRKSGVSLEELCAKFGVLTKTGRAFISVFGREAGGVERRDGRYYLKG